MDGEASDKPKGARALRAGLGEYTVQILGLVLTEGDGKVIMKRCQAEPLMAMEQLR